jgi:hypothetical protein
MVLLVWRISKMEKMVVHHKKAEHDVYIGRPSKWGNPFVIGKDGSRDEVIEKFRIWGKARKMDEQARQELKGKVLGCWCSPQACHGDVLAEWANS